MLYCACIRPPKVSRVSRAAKTENPVSREYRRLILRGLSPDAFVLSPVPEVGRGQHFDVWHPGENPANQFLAPGGFQPQFQAAVPALPQHLAGVPDPFPDAGWFASEAGEKQTAKRHKRRKEGKNSAERAAHAVALAYLAEHVFLDLELWRAEVYEQAVLYPGCPQVAVH